MEVTRYTNAAQGGCDECGAQREVVQIQSRARRSVWLCWHCAAMMWRDVVDLYVQTHPQVAALIAQREVDAGVEAQRQSSAALRV